MTEAGIIKELRAAMNAACDLLSERTYGNPARSPGHNARLALEAALALPLDGQAGNSAGASEQIIRDLVALLMRDAKHLPKEKQERMFDYLRRKKIMPSPLRAALAIPLDGQAGSLCRVAPNSDQTIGSSAGASDGEPFHFYEASADNPKLVRVDVPTPAPSGREMDWVVRKGCYFYRPNSQGYTVSIHEAGRYTREDAKAHASASSGEVTAHPVSEFATPSGGEMVLVPREPTEAMLEAFQRIDVWLKSDAGMRYRLTAAMNKAEGEPYWIAMLAAATGAAQ